jgi:uncharacterized protein (UPF0548 family)
MFLLHRPSRKEVDAFLASQEHRTFSYPEVGASRDRAPDGYTVDHNRVALGHGARLFERAVEAIQHWEMFEMPWLSLCWPETPIDVGGTVAVLTSHFGFWSLNACRIVYVIDDRDSSRRYGFAYGTLTEHAEIGEERFSVEFHPDDESVWYDIYAFSRPTGLARVAYPLSRLLQMRFASDSKMAIRRAVEPG